MYNKYIFDSGPLIDLFTHYYPKRFPTLWDDFSTLVKNGQLMSVREVSKELEGSVVGDVIELPIDCDQLYGARDESLVFTDHKENVPEEYHEVGTTITMENDKGEPKNFIVTRFDDKTLTIDGNNRDLKP